MNCEQCKEEVFELIEREAVDPTGVHEILERCPDCRALFDEMKAALVAVDQLPLEDPPARLDADILRAAVTRRANVTPIRKRRLQAPPWAMAAIALLAVGIGVWSIPRETELATKDALGSPVVESDTDVAAEPRPASVPAELERAGSEKAERTLRLDQEERSVPLAKAPRKPSAPKPKHARTRRKATPSPARQAETNEGAPEEGADVGALAGMQDMAQAPAQDTRATGAARAVGPASESADEEAKEDGDDTESACRKTIADFEKRRRRNTDFKPDAEQELALGRCYAKLGNTKGARIWLERAAAHKKTETRAQSALKKLPPD